MSVLVGKVNPKRLRILETHKVIKFLMHLIVVLLVFSLLTELWKPNIPALPCLAGRRAAGRSTFVLLDLLSLNEQTSIKERGIIPQKKISNCACQGCRKIV